MLDLPALALLEANTGCVIATLMPDKSPYSAAGHFAVDRHGQGLYLSLHANSQTFSNLLSDPRAAITVGFDTAVPATLQMRGEANILDRNTVHEAHEAFYTRFPHSRLYQNDSNTRFVHFRPTWSRYSDATSRRDFFVRGFAPELLR